MGPVPQSLGDPRQEGDPTYLARGYRQVREEAAEALWAGRGSGSAQSGGSREPLALQSAGPAGTGSSASSSSQPMGLRPAKAPSASPMTKSPLPPPPPAPGGMQTRAEEFAPDWSPERVD